MIGFIKALCLRIVPIYFLRFSSHVLGLGFEGIWLSTYIIHLCLLWKPFTVPGSFSNYLTKESRMIDKLISCMYGLMPVLVLCGVWSTSYDETGTMHVVSAMCNDVIKLLGGV